MPIHDGVPVLKTTQTSMGSKEVLRVPGQRRYAMSASWAVLATIGAGGAVGALARYGLQSVWSHATGRFPWATFVINVGGCLLIGLLMVLITEVWRAHRLARPFLVVGVLGGFTTFSTYTGDVQQLVAADAARTALLYLIGSLVSALAAVYAGVTLTRIASRPFRRRRGRS